MSIELGTGFSLLQQRSSAGTSAPRVQGQKAQLSELKAIDRQVRAHELAHSTVGGRYAGAPRYSFVRGPDGLNYAVAGKVDIDTSAISGDPQATIEKMRIIQAAALAPLDPSAEDRTVAAIASAVATAARIELLSQVDAPEQGATIDLLA